MMKKVVSQRTKINFRGAEHNFLTGTPSTRHLLDSVAVRFSRCANFGPRGRVVRRHASDFT